MPVVLQTVPMRMIHRRRSLQAHRPPPIHQPRRVVTPVVVPEAVHHHPAQQAVEVEVAIVALLLPVATPAPVVLQLLLHPLLLLPIHRMNLVATNDVNPDILHHLGKIRSILDAVPPPRVEIFANERQSIRRSIPKQDPMSVGPNSSIHTDDS